MYEGNILLEQRKTPKKLFDKNNVMVIYSFTSNMTKLIFNHNSNNGELAKRVNKCKCQIKSEYHLKATAWSKILSIRLQEQVKIINIILELQMGSVKRYIIVIKWAWVMSSKKMQQSSLLEVKRNRCRK